MEQKRKWISAETFKNLEVDDRLQCRFMDGVAIVLRPVHNKEITVIFEGGCWNGRELGLIREQISKVL